MELDIRMEVVCLLDDKEKCLGGMRNVIIEVNLMHALIIVSRNVINKIVFQTQTANDHQKISTFSYDIIYDPNSLEGNTQIRNFSSFQKKKKRRELIHKRMKTN